MSKFVVTVTGADDDVDPKALTTLSKEFEFVEWGILFSSTQPGTPRYPSKQWRSDLYAETMTVEHPVNLSAHVCGNFTEQFLHTRKFLGTELDLFFKRIQFNKFNDDNSKHIFEFSAESDIPVVVPANKKTTSMLESMIDKSRLSVLFDSSGGRGVAPSEWPDHMKGTHLCGYAGGIDELNCVDVVTRLGARYNDRPFWIDLESGSRTPDNVFDLEKVKRILERVKPFYGENRIVLA
jgi:hypothetical protein